MTAASLLHQPGPLRVFESVLPEHEMISLPESNPLRPFDSIVLSLLQTPVTSIKHNRV